MDDDTDRRSPGAGGAGTDPEPPARDDVMESLRPVREAAAVAIDRSGPGRRGPSSAVLAATLFLIGSTILSVSFMLTRGGLALPVASPEPSDVALASPTVGPSTIPTPKPSASAGPTATPSPTPRPTPSPTPDPRLALLEPCPDKPDCYIYIVKTNDRLAKIAVRFGVPFDTILELNPWITDPNVIHPGDELTLPPPGP